LQIAGVSQSALWKQAGEAVRGQEFGDILEKAISQLESIQKDALAASRKLATGEIADIHEAVIAVEKAQIALQLAVQVRNKIVESYQEIMRMQI